MAAYLIVTDTEADHIDTHICRRHIGVLAIYTLEQGVEDREYLYITVVVDGNFPISVVMEGVYHVHVIQIGCCRLVCDVDRVFQLKVPYRECLKLGISRPYPAFVLVIKLGEADRHLARAWPWGCDDDKRTRRDNVVIFAESIIRCYKLDIMRISVYEIMDV